MPSSKYLIPDSLQIETFPVDPSTCQSIDQTYCQGRYYLIDPASKDKINPIALAHIATHALNLNIFYSGFLADLERLITVDLRLSRHYQFFNRLDFEIVQLSPEHYSSLKNKILLILFHVLIWACIVVFVFFFTASVVLAKKKMRAMRQLVSYEQIFLLLMFFQYFLLLYYYVKSFKLSFDDVLWERTEFADMREVVRVFSQMEIVFVTIYGGLFINITISLMSIWIKKYFFKISKQIL